jgi:hypothetical protein
MFLVTKQPADMTSRAALGPALAGAAVEKPFDDQTHLPVAGTLVKSQ